MTKKEALVLHSAKRIFDCELLEKGGEVRATALGKLLKGGDIVVGDRVLIEEDGSEFIITEVLPRKNEIFRHVQRERKKKTIAANIDTLLIIVSCSLPEYKRGLVDRYLLRAQQWEIPAAVVFNKIDEASDDLDLHFEQQRLKPLSVDVFEVSATHNSIGPITPEAKSFEQLKDYIHNKTALFLGQSGVGKSKLITAITNKKIQLESNRLAKVGKGSHTTTWAQMINFEYFRLIDSPGIRSFSLEDLTEEELIDGFPDLHGYFSNCQFNNCRHEEKSKGCSFKDLDKNKKEDLAILSRLESYQRFKQEIMATPFWQKN